jgi:hypothetical protein
LKLLDLQDEGLLKVEDVERDTIEFRKAISLIDQNINPKSIVLSSKKIQSLVNDGSIEGVECILILHSYFRMKDTDKLCLAECTIDTIENMFKNAIKTHT